MHIKLTPITWFIVLFVLTSVLALIVPASSTGLHTLGISQQVYHLLVVTLLVPYGLIWFAAFYGYEQLQQYSKAVPYNGEGKAFWKITNGLKVLAWGLVLQTILSLILSAVTLGSPRLHGFETIINNYFVLLVALVAFVYINNGTYQLVELVHARRSQTSMRILVIVAVLIGAFFQRFVVYNQSVNANSYYLDINLLVLTVVVPYAFTWLIGMMSVYELRLYSTRVKGVLYRRGLDQLSTGLSIVILISIVVQYVTAAFTATTHESLGSILVIIYVLLAFEALGFALVAIGAKQLKRIEEV